MIQWWDWIWGISPKWPVLNGEKDDQPMELLRIFHWKTGRLRWDLMESSWKFHGNMQQVVSWCQEATSTHWAKSSKKAWLQKFMRCSSAVFSLPKTIIMAFRAIFVLAQQLRVMTSTTLLDFHQPIWMFQRWNSWRDRSPSHLRSAGLTAVKRAQETWHHDMWKQQTWPWWWNQNWMLRLPSSNIHNGKPRFCRSAS